MDLFAPIGQLALQYPIGWGLFLSFSFVGSLYVWADSRQLYRRDEPAVILKRIISVSAISAMAAACTPSSWEAMGMWNAAGGVRWLVLSSISGLLSVALLFLGPLLQKIVAWDTSEDVPQLNLLTCRNLVVAPISEELVFRSCTVPVFLASGWSALATIVVSPWTFSLAHLHHILRNQKLLPTLFQMAYTALFGALSSYLFISTHSLYAAVAAHAFCNYMGFPDIAGAISHDYKYGTLGLAPVPRCWCSN